MWKNREYMTLNSQRKRKIVSRKTNLQPKHIVSSLFEQYNDTNMSPKCFISGRKRFSDTHSTIVTKNLRAKYISRHAFEECHEKSTCQTHSATSIEQVSRNICMPNIFRDTYFVYVAQNLLTKTICDTKT